MDENKYRLEILKKKNSYSFVQKKPNIHRLCVTWHLVNSALMEFPHTVVTCSTYWKLLSNIQPYNLMIHHLAYLLLCGTRGVLSYMANCPVCCLSQFPNQHQDKSCKWQFL